MSLFIYDQGYRIHKPRESLFPKHGLDPLTNISPTHRNADFEDNLHAKGDNFPVQKISQHKKESATHTYEELAEETAPEDSKPPQLAVSQVMVSPVHTVKPTMMTYQAWERMDELNVNHLIVSENGERALGIISKSDLLAEGPKSFNPIEHIYHRKLIAAAPSALVYDIAIAFIDHDINSVPVIDEDEKLVGIVCRTDLLRLLVSGPHLQRWV